MLPKRRLFTALWVSWVAAFAAIEAAAIKANRPEATLSGHIHRAFSVREKRRWWLLRRGILGAALVWLFGHLLVGGKE